MIRPIGNGESTGPPSFDEARSPRQKARAAGMDPNYWYAVEYEHALKPGKVTEVKFWDQSIALFRTSDGKLHAIENRCAHRQLKLSLGHVHDGCLVCSYHGWSYDGDGHVCKIPHDLFGRPMPSFQIRSYPVRTRYGFIWLFPGDSALADRRPMPEIPELSGPSPWPSLTLDFTWQAHHSMIIDNVSDFSHEYLHRRFRPFVGAKLTHCETQGDCVRLGYETQIADGWLYRHFVNRKQVNTRSIDLCYEYPYQWSDTGGKIKHWCFLLPIDHRTTRVFFLFYFHDVQVPFLPLKVPRWVISPILALVRRIIFVPLLSEDGMAVEAEQEGYEKYYDAPLAELNPAVQQFQKLTIQKWQQFLETAQSAGRPHAPGRSVERPQQDSATLETES